jgi:septation ring formation regulator EzrA
MKDVKEILAKRVNEIQAALEQSKANYSMLLGHLEEAKFMLQSIFKEECEAKDAAPAAPAPEASQ